MLTTLTTVAVFLVFLAIAGMAWLLGLWLGLKWAKSEVHSFVKMFMTLAIVMTLGIAVQVAFLFVTPSTELGVIGVGFAELVIGLFIPISVISTMFRLSVGRSFKAWLPTLISSMAMIPLALFVFRPFFLEAFIAPSNTMAPTIIGQHCTGVCPECGAEAVCSAFGILGMDRAEPVLMICGNYHVNELPVADRSTQEGDRILVAKYVQPKRWGLIAFDSPPDPKVKYVMRLVGMPGETIHIANGAVFANGVKLDLPQHLSGLKYTSEIDGWDLAKWGTVDRPAKLGPDEYFVLGDFSARALDSRTWAVGVPGHNPFAVPRSNIDGVVVHRYWPLNRLFTFP